MPRSNAHNPKTRTRVLYLGFVGSLLTLLMAPAASAEEPVRCGTMWYEWVGETAVVQDYTEDPGLSITIVGRYLWAQNTAEPASSTQHTTSVELTAESPNPYEICVGDTTNVPSAEPNRCGTVWYEWVGTTAVVQNYTEDPGLSITIVGHYLWAQNTAEAASSTQHTRSVELTAESPNPYTICIGDTTDSTPQQTATVEQAHAEQAKVTATRQAVAQPAMQLAQVSDILDIVEAPLLSGLRWDKCERQLEAFLCAL